MCREVLKSIRACPVAVRAQKSPESIAFIAAGKSFSYHDFHLEISACQVRLQSQGIRAGDRVLLSDLCPLDSCIMLWTLFRMGAVACPVNPLLPRKNLDAVMAVLEPQWVCHPAESAAACPVFQRLECFDEEGTERGSTFFFTAGRDAAVVMTSGSSGTPRLAIHSFENYMQGAIAANRNMPVVPGDRWLLSLPLFHVAGLAVLFRCALAGAAVVVPEADMSFEEALIQSCATQVSLVPTQLYRLLKSASATEMLRSMKGILLGGAPASSTLIERAYALDIPLICSYGMTETSAQLCATPPGASLEILLSSGFPLLPDTLQVGTDNIIEVRGATLFQGYLTENNVRVLPLTDAGWFRTGDVGCLDEQGCLHVTGRADAMFIVGGENIHPEEVEAALGALPGVCRAVVVPLSHEEYGRVAVAFLDMQEKTVIDAVQLCDRLAEVLPRFKIPRYFLSWPKKYQQGMKIDRSAFAEEAKNVLL